MTPGARNGAGGITHQRNMFFTEQKAPERADREYELLIRQQPVRARMCGFSDTKDRRLIDPPPILQLFVKYGGKRVAISPLECTTLVCHASLWSPNGKEERNIVVNPRGHGDDDATAAVATAAVTSTSTTTSTIPTPTSSSTTNPTSTSTSTQQHQQHPSQPQPFPPNPYYNYPSPYPYAPQFPYSYPPYPTSFPYNVLPTPAPQPTPPATAPTRNPGTGTISFVEAWGLGLVQSQRLCQTLVGSLAVPCTVLTDLDGSEGMFFVFHDLSVRAQGTYRLKFQVVDADVSRNISPAKAITWTNVFEVFSPKVFPGMTESTALSRSFAKQGLPIHIRKDYASLHTVTTHQTPLDDSLRP